MVSGITIDGLHSEAHISSEWARVLVEQLADEDEDGWTYEVEDGPLYSRIAVRDETGHFLGYL